jgi:serine/threonine-protein kinase
MVVCPVTSRVIGRVDRPPDPLIGTVLERKYRIEDKLGEGGMGAVYTGEHLMMKRRVAIKTLLSQFTANPNAVQRFQREAQAASAMGHPNIITIHDLGQTPDGMLYIVMEYLDGRDLGKETRELKLRGVQVMEPQRAFAIMSQVAEGLAAAHEKGVVHRDLKPDNIFLVPNRDGTDRVKLLDFGISKIRTPSPDQSRLTTDGSLLGTPYYMSPEQAQGKSDIDHRADIYAYGVILYELLTGQVPFEDENMLRVIAMHALEEPRPPRMLNPNIPPAVEGLILKAMAKQPVNRFQTMNDVLAGLRQIVAGGINFAAMNVNRSGPLPVGGFDATGMSTPAPIPGSNPSWGATTPAPINSLGSRVGSNVQAWSGAGSGSGSMPGTITATPMAWSEGGPPKAGGGGLKIAMILGGVGLVAVIATVIVVVAMSGGDDEVAVNPPQPITQPTYPTNPVVPTYPTNPVVPTYPTNPVVPTYPTNPVMPTYPIPTQAVSTPTKVAIRIESTPETADVYEGSQRIGTTPYLLTADMGGAPRSFVLKREGYRDRPLSITPDQNRVVTAELERARRTSGTTKTTGTHQTTTKTGGRTKTGHGLTRDNPFGN